MEESRRETNSIDENSIDEEHRKDRGKGQKTAEIAIKATEVTKKFKVYQDKGHTLKEKTLFRKRRSYEARSVLKGVSFCVQKGEAVGLIGHNGCGKSTTLKLLTKIMYPDSGAIEMHGRVSSLLELGAGFHPDMSGRENIYINAAIFGLTKKEIGEREKAIISFSELEEFIDNPVRTYSSGMYMRLAFAVAINVKADILLIDEILAVGDANFQEKCFERLKSLKAEGITIVIVSHSLSQIEQICDRSIWMDGGVIRESGEPKTVHQHYLCYMQDRQRERMVAEKNNDEI
ncbi:MAG: ABC transporter ATP-binding protein [Eubacterium sp.]|nr:ABC transporter ATP-binding protein [Eubacterium sp.]